MGRAGRYTLAVMVWVATFAAWSGVVGLVVAAITGDARPGDEVAAGWTAVFYVLLSAVPTLAALVFNDWAREGFPSREDRRRAARAARDAAAPVAEAPAAPAPSEPAPPEAPRPAAAQPAAPAVAPPMPTVGPAAAEEPPAVVPPIPLDVPEAADPTADPAGYPVAPLLRDR